MSFKTSLGRSFSAGTMHTPYYFATGDGFLTGFFGQGGKEIDHLGVYFMKGVRNVRMLNIHYPTLDDYKIGLKPQIYRTTLCNDGTTPQTMEATFVKHEGEMYTYEVSEYNKKGKEKIVVEGDMPCVVKEKAGVEWKECKKETRTEQKNTEDTRTMNYPVTVDKQTRITAEFTWWDSKCDVEYTATMRYEFVDNTKVD